MILDKEMMHHLSFPDYDVEKFEFSSKNLTLKIFVEGACLTSLTGEQLLGQGFIYFYEWDHLSIRAFNSTNNSWIDTGVEPLKDICEIKFSNSIVSIYGFGATTNNWLELQIHHGKMYAEFAE